MDKNKIVEELFKLLLQTYSIKGSSVREYIISNKISEEPINFDVNSMNVMSVDKLIKDNLKFCFNISKRESENNNIINTKLHLKLVYKFASDVIINITVCEIDPNNMTKDKIDFDIDGLCIIKNLNTYTLCNTLDYSLGEIINKINLKVFKIMKTFKQPTTSRIQTQIKASSTKLMEFLEIMHKTNNMFIQGWKLDNQQLQDVFEPLLMYESDNLNEDNNKCNICNDKYIKYCLKLYCCSKTLCFQCAIDHVESRFANSEIPCPYCRGDPFGWKTIDINTNKKSAIRSTGIRSQQTPVHNTNSVLWTPVHNTELEDVDGEAPDTISNNEIELDEEIYEEVEEEVEDSIRAWSVDGTAEWESRQRTQWGDTEAGEGTW